MVAASPTLGPHLPEGVPRVDAWPLPASCLCPPTGADIIITYYTPQLLQWLKEE